MYWDAFSRSEHLFFLCLRAREPYIACHERVGGYRLDVWAVLSRLNVLGIWMRSLYMLVFMAVTFSSSYSMKLNPLSMMVYQQSVAGVSLCH